MRTHRSTLYTAILIAIATLLGYLIISASLSPAAIAESARPKSPLDTPTATPTDPSYAILQYVVDHHPPDWTCYAIIGARNDRFMRCVIGLDLEHSAFGRVALFSNPSEAYTLWEAIRNSIEVQFPIFGLTTFNNYPGYHAEGFQPPYNYYTQEDFYTAGAFLMGATRTDETGVYSSPDLATAILNAAYTLGYISTASPTPTPDLSATPTSTPTNIPLPSPTGCAIQPLLTENFETGSLGIFTSTVFPSNSIGWLPVSNYSRTGTHSAFAPDVSYQSQRGLKTTQNVHIPANVSQATLTFWHSYAFEPGYDCGFIYFSTNNGRDWNNLYNHFISGGYNTMCNDDGFPQEGWGNSTQGNFLPAQVDLTFLANQDVRIKFEERTDSSVSSAGWWIDDIQFDVQYCPTGPTSTSTPELPTPSVTPTPATPSPTPISEPELAIVQYLYDHPPTGWTCSAPGGPYLHRTIDCYTGVGHNGTGHADNYGDPASAYANWQQRRDAAQANYATFQLTYFNGYPGYHAEGPRPPYNFFTQEDYYVTGARVLGATRVDDTSFHYAPDVAAEIMNIALNLGYLPTPSPTPTSEFTVTPTTTPAVTVTLTNTPAVTITPTVSTTTTPEATVTPFPCSLQFTDVPPGSTFYDHIRCLACRGIVTGYADGTFRPQNNVTRGQIAKVVSNAAGFDDFPPGQLFEDVPPGSIFYDFVQRLASREYMSGYPCGQIPNEPCGPNNLPYFRSSFNATRAQISKIVSNAAGFNDPPGDRQFEDVLPNSTFYNVIYRLTSRGVMQGYPCGTNPNEPCGSGNLPYFRPNSYTTRGQTAKIVANAFFPACQTP